MPPSAQEAATGHVGSRSTVPGAESAFGGSPETLSVHEFLSRLVTDRQALSAFDADSRASLEQAGLGSTTATDVLHATSLVLDYAPIEVVDFYVRSVHTSMEKFAGHQQVAVNHVTPLIPNLQEGMELNMLNTDQVLSAAGDVDEMLSGGQGEDGGRQVDNSQETDNSQQSTGNNNDLGSENGNNDVAAGNDVNVNDLVGDINAAGVAGDVTGLANSGDVNAGNVVGNGVTDVVGGVQDNLGDVTGAGDLTSGVMPEVGGVTNNLPVEDTLQGDAMAPVNGMVEGAVGQVENTAGDVTGGLGLGLE